MTEANVLKRYIGRANQVVYRESAGRDSGGLTQPANSLARWQGNGAQGNGVGIGHGKGWHLAAEAMEEYRGKHIWDDWRQLQTYPNGRPRGVASELADVVIRVADMAEWHGETIASRVGEPAFIGKSVSKPSFGDWVSELHWQVANAWNEHEYDWIGALSDVVHTTERMAAHYGIDLDAAIEAKMEYNRTRSYRHGGKAL